MAFRDGLKAAREPLSWLLLLGGGVLFFAGAFPIVGKLLGADLGRTIVGEIKLATDLNPWVEKMLLAVLGAVAAAIYVKFNFSWSVNKQLIGTGLIAAMWAGTYGLLGWMTSDPLEGAWFTTDGKPLRCYVPVPDGVRLLYIVKHDPVTGLPCTEVTQGMAEPLRIWLRAQREAERRGERLVVQPIAEPKKFFDGHGNPVIWYYRRQDGGCEYFEVPAFHPTHGVRLQPVDTQEVAACRGANAAAERRKAEEQQRIATRKATDERREAEAQAQAKAAQATQALLDRYVGTAVPGNSTVVATSGLGALDSAVLEAVAPRGHAILLKPGFAADGLFDSAWNGADEFSRLGIRQTRGIVLVKPASGARVTRAGGAFEGLTYARQDFAVVVTRSPGSSSARHAFTAEGRAFNDADAQAELRSDFTAKLRQLIAAHL